MSNNLNNQRCSKCYQKYSGLKATCSGLGCNHEHFFKKNGQLLCVMCIMRERDLKCQKCRKIITRLEELGKWKGNSVLVDDHTFDINSFVCECRECNHSENRKNKLKRCQGTFSVHYNGGMGQGGSTQLNQCDFAIPADGGNFCHLCKGQTETYQRLRARLDKEQAQEFEKYKQAYEKAQNYWNSLSSSEREKECERILEDMKLGKYRHLKGEEGEIFGWVPNWSLWKVENGKLVSDKPHLVPALMADEFYEKMWSGSSKELVLRDFRIVRKDDNNDNSISPNPAAPQPIVNSNDKNDNLVSPANSPKPNPGVNQASEIKILLNQTEDNKNNPSQPTEPKKENNRVLVISLKDIKKISIVGDNLVIEYGERSQAVSSEQVNGDSQLSAIRNYLQTNRRSSVEAQELSGIFKANNSNPGTGSPVKKSPHPLLWIGVGGAFFLSGLVLLIVKVKKSRSKKK